jgi:hypothetical protein
MNMSEFSTLLTRIDALGAKVEALALSLGNCQTLCSSDRGRRRGWITWLGGAAIGTLSTLLGFYLRR